MKPVVIIGLLFALSACGAARDLKPAAGKALPVAPYGATATPAATALLTPSVQARPGRSDELLTASEERKGDEYDLPPAN
ncbi:MAG: hypothetical protein V4459_00615 [Pseudomonadota bacterium]